MKNLLEICWAMVQAIIAFTVFIVLVLGVSVGFYSIFAEPGCKAYAESSSIAYRYSFHGGCFVEAKPSVWVPRDVHYALMTKELRLYINPDK